jgi:hypothetical protein
MTLKKVEGFVIVKVKVPTLLKTLKDGRTTIEPNCPKFCAEIGYSEAYDVVYGDAKNVKLSKECVLRMAVRKENVEKVKKKIKEFGLCYVPDDEDMYVEDIWTRA